DGAEFGELGAQGEALERPAVYRRHARPVPLDEIAATQPGQPNTRVTASGKVALGRSSQRAGAFRRGIEPAGDG
ncbi:MAG: hypothetical protein ACM3OA_02925, partial [Acidobacteriota bacterium]